MICGIDPGLNGALAFFSDRTVIIDDMPTLMLARGGKNKREVDAKLLADCLILTDTPDHVFLEQVASMPGQGVSSMFAMGKSYGIVIGVLAALNIPYTLVPPQRWKRALQVPAAKDGARARASQLMPESACLWPLVKHHGRAEAALIAYWGMHYALT